MCSHWALKMVSAQILMVSILWEFCAEWQCYRTGFLFFIFSIAEYTGHGILLGILPSKATTDTCWSSGAAVSFCTQRASGKPYFSFGCSILIVNKHLIHEYMILCAAFPKRFISVMFHKTKQKTGFVINKYGKHKVNKTNFFTACPLEP